VLHKKQQQQPGKGRKISAMTIQDIPLNQLEHSPLNARKTRSKDRIEQFAASIEAHGILQNLHAAKGENGKFQVAIGGTRLAALHLLLKRKKIAANYPVPCEVHPANDPVLREISLAENIVREAMHPADEFDAFRHLADEGQGPETIAARFGTSPTMVRQRLKLAVVSPRLIAVFRKDEMTLDQLMAFTLTDEHRKQEKIWKELPEWNKRRGDAEPIRAALTEEHVAASSRLARFVGIEAYEKAGGGILRDLFDEKGDGWLTDFALLNRLAAEKLETAAEPIRAEGWKWIEIAPELDWQQTQKDGYVQPARAAVTAEQQAEIDTLQAEADTIMQKHGEEPQDEAAYGRLAELQEAIGSLSEGQPVWTLQQKAIAGVYVTIGQDSDITIQRGIVKPEDKAALRRLTNGADKANGAGESEPVAKTKSGLPAALIAELTSHKTVAAQLVMASNPAVAMMAVTQALAVRMLYDGLSNQCTTLEISAHGPSYSLAVRETVGKSAAARKLATLVRGWQRKLPKKPEDLWEWMTKQKAETIRGLLAVCTAMTVDMVQVNGAAAKPASNDLAKAMKLDMADHWEATPDSYFTRVPRKHLLAELGGALKPNTRKQVEGMKRDMMAKTVAGELKGKRWLPDVLKAG
jgi:ParB family transcriptional regulator, chromosome partitioning protein